MPHPTLLRRLVEEYETLMAHQGDGEDGTARRDLRAQDLAYTLCVSTGTREVGRALEAARACSPPRATPPLPAVPHRPMIRPCPGRRNSMDPDGRRGAETTACEEW